MPQPTLILAPLKGFTDHVFRTVFTHHFGGFDLAVAPFISSKKDRKFKPKYIKDVLPDNNTVQIEAVVTKIQDEPEPSVFVDGLLSVDGLVIYKMEKFGLKMIKID